MKERMERRDAGAERVAQATLTVDRDLIARRTSQFGLVGALLGVVAFVFRLPRIFGVGAEPSTIWTHLAGVAILGFVYAAAKSPKISPERLRVLDSAGTVLSSLAYGVMAACISAGPHKGLDPMATTLMLLLILTYIVVLRAALVPSSAKRTFFVTAACIAAAVPLARPQAVDSFGNGTSTSAFGTFVGSLMWWTLATALATVISSVIYGLHREVREARQFGQYHLLEQIGEGGMGLVYRARHHMLRRETALKLLPPSRSSASAVTRFEREVRLTAQLTHANTVTIFDYGRTPDGLFYYTMELLDGATLEEIVRRTGPLPAARVVSILRQVAGALAEAHALGLVHRDVKPSNIMLCRHGGELDVAKVLDFGLVRDGGPERAAGISVASEILGTPQFMSPEAIVSPEKVSAASDLYSLGATAYFLLTGAYMFDAGTLVEVCSHHLHTPPPSAAARADLPPELDALLLSTVAKDAKDRPESARSLAGALDAIEIEPWSAEDAEKWWSENAARVLVRGKRGDAPGSSVTLEVDFARRYESDRSALANGDPSLA